MGNDKPAKSRARVRTTVMKIIDMRSFIFGDNIILSLSLNYKG
jgi:hypothetical protein